ncbi:MAG: ribonuclease P protein component [Vicingaceae bacterium]
MITKNKYSKNEKLKSKKDLEHLFKKGKSINAFPVRLIYVKKNELMNVSINAGVTVSKKNIKLAVNRNLIKRRIREAYRLNNKAIIESLKKNNTEINLMFIYTSKEVLPYHKIEAKIKTLLNRLIEKNELVIR